MVRVLLVPGAPPAHQQGGAPALALEALGAAAPAAKNNNSEKYPPSAAATTGAAQTAAAAPGGSLSPSSSPNSSTSSSLSPERKNGFACGRGVVAMCATLRHLLRGTRTFRNSLGGVFAVEDLPETTDENGSTAGNAAAAAAGKDSGSGDRSGAVEGQQWITVRQTVFLARERSVLAHVERRYLRRRGVDNADGAAVDDGTGGDESEVWKFVEKRTFAGEVRSDPFPSDADAEGERVLDDELIVTLPDVGADTMQRVIEYCEFHTNTGRSQQQPPPPPPSEQGQGQAQAQENSASDTAGAVSSSTATPPTAASPATTPAATASDSSVAQAPQAQPPVQRKTPSSPASGAQDNRAAIVAAGGIEPLVSLLLDGSPEAKVNAAGALRQIAQNNAEYQRLLVNDGGVEAFEKLLKTNIDSANRQRNRLLLRNLHRVRAQTAAGKAPGQQQQPVPPQSPAAGTPSSALAKRPKDNSAAAARAWDASFVGVKQSILCELASASYYLDIRALVNLTSRAIASQISGKTSQEIRETFGSAAPGGVALPAPPPAEAATAAQPELQAGGNGHDQGPPSHQGHGGQAPHRIPPPPPVEPPPPSRGGGAGSGSSGVIEHAPSCPHHHSHSHHHHHGHHHEHTHGHAGHSHGPATASARKEDTRSVDELLAFLGEADDDSSKKGGKKRNKKKNQKKNQQRSTTPQQARDSETQGQVQLDSSPAPKKGSPKKAEPQVPKPTSASVVPEVAVSCEVGNSNTGLKSASVAVASKENPLDENTAERSPSPPLQAAAGPVAKRAASSDEQSLAALSLMDLAELAGDGDWDDSGDEEDDAEVGALQALVQSMASSRNSPRLKLAPATKSQIQHGLAVVNVQ